MSSKLIKGIVGVVEIGVGVALMFVPGGQALGTSLIMAGAATEVSLAVDALTPKPKVSSATQSRLNASLVPTEARKILFGSTALATDVRYQGYTGSNQEYLDQIVACASHQVQSIDEIWFDNEKAWTLAGGAQGRFAGYLTVDVRTVGTRTNGIAIDATWTANATLTGCAYVHLRYKLTGNSKKTDSPFASGVPSRMTIRGKGMLVYDPRFDSTVAGGSGPQRANDQTTWAYSTGSVESGRNPALQLLAYLIGWRIQNPSTLAWRLAVGRGVPPARIDLTTFITAANVCDETVALAAGGTEPRYRSDGIFSEADDGKAVRDTLLASMNGWLDDGSGKLSLGILKNDLGTPFLALSEKDVLGDEQLPAAPSIETIPNIVRGRYVDASDNALYQMSDYPEVSLASGDGIDRLDPTDFPNVQSASQVQRTAKQRLQRKQYPLRYSATFGSRAWQLSRGKVVTFSHQGLGWANKLFRVASIGLTVSGTAQLTLEEENAAIYAWSAGETAPVAAAAPTAYDPQNAPILLGIGEARNVTYRQATDPTGSYTVRDGDWWVDTSGTPMVLKTRMSGSWQFVANYISQGSDIGVSNGATRTWSASTSAPGSPATGDEWPDTSVTPTALKRWSGTAWVVIANLVTQGTDIGVANAAGTTFTANVLGATANVKLSGNGAVALGAASYSSSVQSKDAFTCCALTFRGTDLTLNGRFVAGLVSPTNTSGTNGYTLLTYPGLLANSGSLVLLDSVGNTLATGPSYAATDVLGIFDDGVTVTYRKNGVSFYSVASLRQAQSGHFALAQNGAFADARFEPITDNGLSSKDGKLPKVTNLPNVVVFNTGYKFTGTISATTAAGTPATATISITAGNLLSGDTSIAINASSVNVTGTGGTTISYFLTADDPTNAGGALTITAVPASSSSTVLSSNSRIQVGEIDIAFPTSGTGTGTGYAGGGGGYSGGGGGSGRPALP